MNVQQASLVLKENYGIYFTDFTEQISDYSLQDLIKDTTKSTELLQRQSEQMHDCSLIFAGTIFGKRYSVLSMGFLESIVQHGLIWDASPDHSGLRLLQDGCMGFVFPRSSIRSISEMSEKEIQALLLVFKQTHITPLFHAVSQCSGSKENHMHSLVEHNYHQAALRLSRRITNHQLLKLCLEVLAPNTNFRLFTPGGEPFYIRKHCCFAYRIADDHGYCSTCPLLTDDKRC